MKTTIEQNKVTKFVTFEPIQVQFYLQEFDPETGLFRFKSKAAGSTSLAKLIQSIKNPKPKLKNLIDQIRTETDKKKRTELKSQLPGFIIQSYGTGIRRNYDNLLHFTGYSVLDFDGDKVRGFANELKQFLFESFDFVAASFVSPSGAVKCIIKVDKAESIEDYQNLYRGLENLFNDYVGFDSTPKNAVLIMFYTYDKEILIRSNPATWTKRILKEKRPVQKVEFDHSNIDLNQRRVYGYIQTILTSIVDNGHPQLITASKLLGGFCSAYGIDLFEAENWIHRTIEGHPYLSKGIAGYIKTASEFIRYGASEPINLPE